ncbi:unnamed protein product [[Candida] boidinii]|uniref:Unnamed protein product n=1 Tax=Candida boidinii TaxID=5477 RepID=A0ACB5U004_CANBO|nr:unnamed protein product [[Candida] boidinii]
MILITYECGEGCSAARDLYTGETGLVPKDYVQIIDENDLKEMGIEPDVGYNENYEIYGNNSNNESSQDNNTLVENENDKLEVTIEEDENEIIDEESEEQKNNEILSSENIDNDNSLTTDQISKKIENFKINN